MSGVDDHWDARGSSCKPTENTALAHVRVDDVKALSAADAVQSSAA